jgi:hypothetical protein
MADEKRQINVKLNDEKLTKVKWLSEILDENYSSLVKRLIDAEYESQKARYESDQQFVRWIRSQNS